MATFTGGLFVVAAALLLVAAPVAAEDWEWAGVFELKQAETYTWSASRVEGEYADPAMKLVIVPAEHADMHGLEEAVPTAKNQWKMSPWQWQSGTQKTINNAVAYKINFDQGTWVSIFKIRVARTGAYAFFGEHLPTEFEDAFHYLKDSAGEDIEPKAELEGAAEEDHHEEWGAVIGGTILTALPSLIVILILGPILKKASATWTPPAAIFAFASGAIFSCAVMLLLAEGLHLAGEEQDEVTGTWTWGTAIMLGWFLGMVIHHGSELALSRGARDEAYNGGANAGDVEAVEGEAKKEPQRINWAVAGPVLFGDFWHNLVDGAVIGFAFKSCSHSMAWGIVGATIAHEVPQEVADFLILIQKARMGWPLAAALNFLAGLSAVIGGIITYSTEVSNNGQGLCLAMGGGVYLFVALTEIGPQVSELGRGGAGESLARAAAFIIGAIAVALVLIGHEHCGGGEGGHHHHRRLHALWA